MSATRAYRQLRGKNPKRLSICLDAEIEREAKRLGVTPSYLLRVVWRIARPSIAKLKVGI